MCEHENRNAKCGGVYTHQEFRSLNMTNGGSTQTWTMVADKRTLTQKDKVEANDWRDLIDSLVRNSLKPNPV
jgi:hypothetical protein